MTKQQVEQIIDLLALEEDEIPFSWDGEEYIWNCQYSQEGLTQFPKQRIGRILGESKNKGCWKIIWRGRVSISTYSKYYIKEISQEEAENFIININEKKFILLGDVLKKIWGNHEWSPKECKKYEDELLLLWTPCDISKSLQQISESGWEENTISADCGKTECLCSFHSLSGIDRLKSPARELFEFLGSIFLIKSS